MGVCIKARMEEIKTLDRVDEERGLSFEGIERKRLLVRELEISLLQKEISWRQKSRIRWLKEGDKCTEIFHRMANATRRHNSIDSLVVDGSVTLYQEVISSHVTSFYKSLFIES